MIAWNWTREDASPDDILDAARTIHVSNDALGIDLTYDWTEASEYLDWACAALQRGGEDGWDAAAAWAKRAVCRQMDGILAHNHLSHFLGRNHKEKATYLAELKVPGLALLRDLVIDPRNEIEHAYEKATKAQAHQSHDVADLFLRATKEAAHKPAIISLGWDIYIWRTERVLLHGIDKDLADKLGLPEFDLPKDHAPMLLIDGYPTAPTVLVLIPQEQTIRSCPLSAFNYEQAFTLNARLCGYSGPAARPPGHSGPFRSRSSLHHLGGELTAELRSALNL